MRGILVKHLAIKLGVISITFFIGVFSATVLTSFHTEDLKEVAVRPEKLWSESISETCTAIRSFPKREIRRAYCAKLKVEYLMLTETPKALANSSPGFELARTLGSNKTDIRNAEGVG
jgi:hypothetical protein